MSKIVLGAGPPVRPPAPCVLPDADAHSKKGLHKRHDQRCQEDNSFYMIHFACWAFKAPEGPSIMSGAETSQALQYTDQRITCTIQSDLICNLLTLGRTSSMYMVR